AELPLDLVTEDSNPLDELHLSSVTVMHIIDQATQRLVVPAGQTPANLSTASLRELGEALDRMAAEPRAQSPAGVAGAAPGVRAFAVNLDEVPRPSRAGPGTDGQCTVYAPAGSAPAQPLREALNREKIGSGVPVC